MPRRIHAADWQIVKLEPAAVYVNGGGTSAVLLRGIEQTDGVPVTRDWGETSDRPTVDTSVTAAF